MIMQNNTIEKTALVLEGGGFRGIFTAGVLEVFLQHQLFFDYAVGVSAGASYTVSYVSQQPNRNLQVNRFISDRRYAGLGNLLFHRSFFNWNFIFEEIPKNRVILDWDALKNSPTRFWIGVTNCNTGKFETYLLNPTLQPDFKTILAASCSLPLIAPIVGLNNQEYLDGGLANSIPFEHALASGNERAIVVLTRPKGYVKPPLKRIWILKWMYRKYPNLVELIITRPEKYNESIKRLEELAKAGKVFVICPESEISVGRLENNPDKTEKVYYEGMRVAEKLLPELKEWLKIKN
jgi:predicted patatin/cPLA2 family phospholipase